MASTLRLRRGGGHHRVGRRRAARLPGRKSGGQCIVDEPAGKEAVPRKISHDGDVAGGLLSKITLSAPGRLTAFCCSVPGMVLFPTMGLIVASFFLSSSVFYATTAVLSALTFVFTMNMAVSAGVGAFRLRRDARKDWHAMVEELATKQPEINDCLHIVILPNYKENETMLLQTLEKLGTAPVARSSMYVVLAMEEREGSAVAEKANRLIQKTSHLFGGIIASYHPVGLPGDLPGKSSNSQWGYREAMRQFSSQVSKVPSSQVFVTVGDADALWHPQFFSAMMYQAFTMSMEERVWSIWQPPVLLFRNLMTVPGMIRGMAYVTLLFELAGITNQLFQPHCCYSSYSMTLALASHPRISGWDTDVIAEDHHMFCKCYFASIWEALGDLSDPQTLAQGSKLRLRPVYLPAMSYLVESDEGWLASINAQFQQSRRHSQGIHVLSYVILQYAKLVECAGFFNLPVRVHRGTFAIASKMASVHLLNSLQAFAAMLAVLGIGKTALEWAMSGGVDALITVVTSWQMPAGSTGEMLAWAIPAIFGPFPPMVMAMIAVVFMVLKGVMMDGLGGGLKQQDADGNAEATRSKSKASRWRRALGLFMMVQNDFTLMGSVTLILLQLTPACLASWSLMRRGPKFEYVVAAKPS